MLRVARFVVPAMVLAMVMPLALVRAEPTETKPAADATLKGKVVMEDGSAAANVEVRVMPVPAKKDKGNKSAQPAAGREKREPVASGTTDANGEFKLSVPAGDYVVMAGKAKTGAGRATVKVASGETASVTVTLKKLEKPKGGAK